MPKQLKDLVKATELAAYIETVPSNNIPALGATLFPAKKKRGLDLKWIKGANQLPVALKPAAFDAKAPIRDRQGFSEMQNDMPFFRESMMIDEKLRQEIAPLLESSNESYKILIAQIFDDAKTLVDGADVQPERMRMQLLTTGKIGIKVDGKDAIDYDYGHDNDLKEVLVDGKWDDPATSVPVLDIMRAKKAVANKGGSVTRMIMNSNTLANLSASESIAKDINPIGAANLILTEEDVKAYIKRKTGITIGVYDKLFVDETGTTKQYVPDGVVSFIPDGTLGSTWYGTTPEELDATALKGIADVRVVNTGVAITTRATVDPVSVQTIVSEIVMPSFERINEVFILTAF